MAQPVQVGHDKFKMTYLGSENAGLQWLQDFCPSTGFSYAELMRQNNINSLLFRYGAEVEFYCMNPGDTITSRNAPKICVGVTNC